MADNTLNQQLQAGIAAAKAGNRAAARELLEGVLAQDSQNELAWVWLAGVVNTIAERRVCLERVLAINPNNEVARRALIQLGGTPPSPPEPPPSTPPPARSTPPARATPPPPRPVVPPDDDRRSSGPRLLLYVVGGVVLIAVVASLVSSLLGPQVVVTSITDTPIPIEAFAQIVSPTPFPTLTPNIVLVTRAPATLPPTFTPTPAPTEAFTNTPTPTPFPLGQYTIFYTAREPGSATVSLYRVRADGTGDELLLEDVRDVAFDFTGQRIAFVRDVPTATVNEAGEAVLGDALVGQVFVADLDNLSGARQITRLERASAYTPIFHPRSDQIVFVSDYLGNDDLFLFDPATGLTTQLTNHPGIDRDPTWSPDGTAIVFASDRETPLYTDLYVLQFLPDGGTTTRRLTRNLGSSYAPAFSPDGQRIAFINDGNLRVVGTDGQRLQTLISDGSETRQPVWSADSRFIGFLSNREDERFQMYFVEPPNRAITRVLANERVVTSMQYQPALIFRIPR
ncbi:hypothetical protein VZO05_12160 [Aggregatilineales bacterium SYSU G02658]